MRAKLLLFTFFIEWRTACSFCGKIVWTDVTVLDGSVVKNPNTNWISVFRTSLNITYYSDVVLVCARRNIHCPSPNPSRTSSFSSSCASCSCTSACDDNKCAGACHHCLGSRELPSLSAHCTGSRLARTGSAASSEPSALLQVRAAIYTQHAVRLEMAYRSRWTGFHIIIC